MPNASKDESTSTKSKKLYDDIGNLIFGNNIDSISIRILNQLKMYETALIGAKNKFPQDQKEISTTTILKDVNKIFNKCYEIYQLTDIQPNIIESLN